MQFTFFVLRPLRTRCLEINTYASNLIANANNTQEGILGKQSKASRAALKRTGPLTVFYAAVSPCLLSVFMSSGSGDRAE